VSFCELFQQLTKRNERTAMIQTENWPTVDSMTTSGRMFILFAHYMSC